MGLSTKQALKKPPKKRDHAARVTIHGPGKMTVKGRKQIASWLKRTAADLVELGNQYTESTFTARYYY